MAKVSRSYLDGYREYRESTLDEQDEHDPRLLGRDGSPVETWRENYPYDERLGRQDYERVKRRLQIELLNLQNRVQTQRALGTCMANP